MRVVRGWSMFLWWEVRIGCCLSVSWLVGGLVVDEVGVCSCQVQGRCTGGSSGWFARIAAVTGDAVAGEVARTDARSRKSTSWKEAAKLLW